MTSTPPSDGLRVVYMGTPDFAVCALEALIASHHDVVGVFTQPDRHSGRGKKVRRPPVKVVAQRADVGVVQPQSLRREPACVDTLETWAPDVVVVAAYGQILPDKILSVPRLGCVNIHASLLPKYRGAAPINWAIVDGETTTGITMMQMDIGLDTGPMLASYAVDIDPDMTAEDLHDQLAQLGADRIVETLDELGAGRLEPTPQDDSAASYARMLSKDDGHIDWGQTSGEVANHIRGFNPWPGAFGFHGAGDEQTRIKFHRARPLLAPDISPDVRPGEVIEADGSAGRLVIATGDGGVECVEVQAPGRRAMGARDFLNGYDLAVGDRFV